MPWTKLATSLLSGGELTLYVGEDGAYMIRANGLELMNGRSHGSEDVLGATAGALARQGGRKMDPHILIGGLGLGYTLAAAVKALDGAGRITVAEISPDVIAWYERYFEAALFAGRPENLRLVPADVTTLLNETTYDVIVLDVDNGPRALASPENDHLYSAEGLGALRSALVDDGVLLVWSGFEAPDFADRAVVAGFAVACETIAISERAGLSHYIYRLSKTGEP